MKTESLAQLSGPGSLDARRHTGQVALIAAGVFVLFQAAMGAAFPPEIEFSSLLPVNGGDGQTGSVLEGEEWSCAAISVSDAGDINDDGFDDVIAGGSNITITSSGGKSFVVFGSATGLPAKSELLDLYAANGGDGTAGFVISGVDAERPGKSVSAAGDVNGDGKDDLIIGAPGPDFGGPQRPGSSYVVFGGHDLFAAEFELSDLLLANGGDGSAGFVIQGLEIQDRLGTSVSGAGDVNGDGIDDLIIGAPAGEPDGMPYAGRAVVIFGTDSGFPAEIDVSDLLAVNGGDGSAGFILSGVQSYEFTGVSVSAAGDINGDGFDDVVIGAPGEHPDPPVEFGESYVVFGTDQGFAPEIELSSLLAINGGDGSAGFAIIGATDDDNHGLSVSGTGDVNNDGIDDLVVSATTSDPNGVTNAGIGYVIFGTDQGFQAQFDLSTLLLASGGDGSTGFAMNGVHVNEYMGTSVSGAGDLNGDGINDVMIGSPLTEVTPGRIAGRVYVVLGKSNGFAAEINLADLLIGGGGDGSAGFILNGIYHMDSAGQSVSPAGDINGDSINDIIVGAPCAASPNERQNGQAYVIYGRSDFDADGIVDGADNCSAHFNPSQLDTNGDGFGNRCDPDLNGDLVVNFLDLSLVQQAFFSQPGHTDWNPDADFDGDLVVNFLDLSIMTGFFFGPPGPGNPAPKNHSR